jgi:NAD-dependent DNA ligase
MKQTLKKYKKFPQKRSFNRNKHLKRGGTKYRGGMETAKKPTTKKKKPRLVIVEEEPAPAPAPAALATTITEVIQTNTPQLELKKIEPAEIGLKTPTQKLVEMELPTGRLNEKFIDLMDKLAAVVANQGETANERMQNRFKSRAYKKAQETIMSYQGDITSPSQLKGMPGIGETIMEKLNEYVTTGKLRLLEREKENPINLLAEVYGIGAVKAKELVDKGVKTLDQLRERQDELLNDTQKVGLKYHADIMRRIPRAEITKYDQIFSADFQKVLTAFPAAAAASRFEIVGSYRRGAADSGDIDMIITSSDKNVFKAFVDMLIGQKIIVEVLARGPTKCLVITRLPDEPYARRVDFLYASPEEYPFAVLYFTGSKNFNTVMRARALELGYTLNEHEMSKMEPKTKGEKSKKGEKVAHIFKDEKDIFDFLGLEYKTPQERVDGRSAVVKPPTLATKLGNLVETALSASAFAAPLEKVEKAVDTALEKVVKKPKKPKSVKQKLKIAEEAVEALESIVPAIPEVVPVLHEVPAAAAAPEVHDVKKEKKPRKPRTPNAAEKVKGEKAKKAVKLAIAEEAGEFVEVAKKSSTPEEVLQLIAAFQKMGIQVLEHLSEDQLAAIVTECDKAFHYNKEPLMSDMQYDIVKEYMEKKYPQNSIFKQVGTPIEKNKVELPYEMASMDKIKPDTGILNSWKQKYHGPYVLSCKLDGVSGLYSTEGKTAKLYTRGNGKVGQDVSHLIPFLRLPKTKGLVVRGEFIMPKTVFEEKYASKFANIRNLVAGIVNRQTIDEKANDLHFVCYEVVKPELKPSAQMAKLISDGFETVQNRTVTDVTNEMLSELLVEWRKSYIYEIDGVIVSDDRVYPRKSGNPDHAFAFKMVLSDQMAEAKVVNVIWTPSKDGYLKPRVQIEPVKLGGVTIEYATGFNAAFIRDNKIGIGALIQIIRSGDVIPHIRGVTLPAPEAKMPDVPYKWNDTNIDIMLEDAGSNVTVLEKNITGFFKGIGVDGLSSGNIARIVAAGFDSVPKIIHMTKADFLKVEGFKEKLATKIYEGIRTGVDKAPLIVLMADSNIFGRGLGERKIGPILEAYPDILVSPESPAEKIKKVAAIKGMAKKSAEAFVEKIPAFLAFIQEAGLESKLGQATEAAAVVVDTTHPLYKKSVVMTGIRDEAVKDALKTVGANLGSSVSKNTVVVIAKSKDEDTGKAAEARKLGIPIMTPAEFLATYFA